MGSFLLLSAHKIRQDPNQSTELVYKANLCEPKFPGGTLKVSEHVDAPYPEQLEWQIYTEPKEGPDLFIDKILNQVKEGKSFTCLGPPGVGKTFLVGKVKECLEELNQNVVCLAPTHCAARLLPDGMTVHHFVGKYAMQGAFKGWILLDEVSMCVLPILAALDQLRMIGTKIITFGDWLQLPPVGNSWRGHPIESQAFRSSRLYKQWSDCTCFELTKCRRSDETHFQFYTSLNQNLGKAVTESKKRYREADDADLHICISHKRRRIISHEKQKRLASSMKDNDCVKVPISPDGEPEFLLFEGTQLIGNTTNGKIVNGGMYSVIKVTQGKDQVTLQDDKGETFEISLEAISKCCLLAHAMVYNKVQGRTVPGSLMLHDTSSKYFKNCHLYVGLSRATHGDNVFVACD